MPGVRSEGTESAHNQAEHDAGSGFPEAMPEPDRGGPGDRVFDEFGVSTEVERAYRRILARRKVADSELAEVLCAPEDAARHLIETMAEMGLVEERHEADGGRQWIGKPPEQAIETLIAAEEKRIEERRARLAVARHLTESLIEDFVSDHSESRSGEPLEVIESPRAIRSRMYQLCLYAKETALTMIAGNGYGPRAIEASEVLDRLLASRGVEERILVSGFSLADQGWVDYLSRVGRLGAEVRAHPDPPLTMVTIDDTVGVIPAVSGDDGGPAMVVYSAPVVAALNAFFREAWRSARPLTIEAGTGDHPAGDPRLLPVVRLLAQGHKDEAIARRLDLSVRTVRRLVATAVEELQAASRFQAGVLAVRNGWLDSPE
ncbi:MAG: helix-turn-helix transcriptional regulator [Nocardioides sp.]